MANLKEQNQTWDEGVYQIETSDPVLGGENGVTNKPLINLANRTAYLKRLLELIEKEIKDLSYSDVGAAPAAHDHAGIYAAANHNHDATYSKTNHGHSDLVPTARKINNKALTTDINLTATDIGSAPAEHDHAGIYAAANHNHDAMYAKTNHAHSDLVPTTRKINNLPLTTDVVLTAGDVGAAPAAHYHTDLSTTNASNIDVIAFLDKLQLRQTFIGNFGWHRFPNGLIFQWGVIESQNGENKVWATFPIGFPTACLNVSLTTYVNPGQGINTPDVTIQLNDFHAGGFYCFFNRVGALGGWASGQFFAVGY